MNKIFKILTPLIILVVVIPLALYLSKFNNGLSSNSQDWGAFGSYLSGIYSPIFSLISVIILISTLNEMRKTSKQEKENFDLQLEIANTEKQLNDVISLTKMLDSIIDSNPTINQRHVLPIQFAAFLKTKCYANQVTESEELWEQAYNVMRDQKQRFSSEMYVLAELLRRVNSIRNAESKYTAKAIVKGLIPNSYRFWLECYGYVWSSEVRNEISNWHDFSEIPDEAEGILPEEDNSQEVFY